jgi:hypothetical protein
VGDWDEKAADWLTAELGGRGSAVNMQINHLTTTRNDYPEEGYQWPYAKIRQALDDVRTKFNGRVPPLHMIRRLTDVQMDRSNTADFLLEHPPKDGAK